MPTISERQSLIQEILHAANDLSHVSRMDLTDELQSSDSESSQSESAGNLSSSLSSSSSSSSNSSTSSSGSEELMSVDDADTDEERSIIMGMTADLLQVITETRVLNPHLVTKCSQLDLILIDFKLCNPKRFRHNLRVSASTFDSLLKIIETHPIFFNDGNFPQGPVAKQLAVDCFGLAIMGMQRLLKQSHSGQG